MGIRAVVFDVGGVLEITGEMTFAGRWERKLGLPAGSVGQPLEDVWAAGAIGTITEDAVHRTIGERLGIAPEKVDAMMADMWVEYLGVANTELIEFARGLRPRLRTGILSNSFVGAREREQAAYGFEDLVDEIVYSHEVGMCKPDPRIYALVCARLGTSPEETVFLDDVERAVLGARDAGLHAVHFTDNARAIRELRMTIAGHADGAACL
jgi:epoxide hydrolase-like predicted phosphatase